MDRPVYSVHLFAGAGGGLLADLLVGTEPRIAVEIEPYPRRVLGRRLPVAEDEPRNTGNTGKT